MRIPGSHKLIMNQLTKEDVKRIRNLQKNHMGPTGGGGEGLLIILLGLSVILGVIHFITT